MSKIEDSIYNDNDGTVDVEAFYIWYRLKIQELLSSNNSVLCSVFAVDQIVADKMTFIDFRDMVDGVVSANEYTELCQEDEEPEYTFPIKVPLHVQDISVLDKLLEEGGFNLIKGLTTLESILKNQDILNGTSFTKLNVHIAKDIDIKNVTKPVNYYLQINVGV